MSSNNSSYKIKSIQERDRFYSIAVKEREAGNLIYSLNLFLNIKEFDEKNNLLEHLVDVLGHIRIVYTRLAENTKNKSQKQYFLYKAIMILKDAIDICQENSQISKETKSVLYAHISSVILKLSLQQDTNTNKMLRTALKYIDKSIKNLSGSQAHKSWPANIKAQILLELGQPNKSLKVISRAESWLKKGKDEEINSDPDHGQIKIDVWTTGLYLTKAKIYMAELKPILAKFYIQQVLNYKTIGTHLEERKKDALHLLEQLNEKFWYVDNIKLNELAENEHIYKRNLLLENYIKLNIQPKIQKTDTEQLKKLLNDQNLASASQTHQLIKHNQNKILDLIKRWDKFNKNKLGETETTIAEMHNIHQPSLAKNISDINYVPDINNTYIKIAKIQRELDKTNSKEDLHKYLKSLAIATHIDKETEIYIHQLKAKILYKLQRTRESLETLSQSSYLLDQIKNSQYYKILKLHEANNYTTIYKNEEESHMLKSYLKQIEKFLE